MPPNPPSNAHGFAMRSMSLRDMQIPKSEKKNSWPPPLPNPGDAPDYRQTDRLFENQIRSSIPNRTWHTNTCSPNVVEFLWHSYLEREF